MPQPTLQALEARLAGHAERGEIVACDTRHAALLLLSPLFAVVALAIPIVACTRAA